MCIRDRFTNVNGKDVWKPKSREKMVGMKPEDILAQFNLEIKGDVYKRQILFSSEVSG